MADSQRPYRVGKIACLLHCQHCRTQILMEQSTTGWRGTRSGRIRNKATSWTAIQAWHQHWMILTWTTIGWGRSCIVVTWPRWVFSHYFVNATCSYVLFKMIESDCAVPSGLIDPHTLDRELLGLLLATTATKSKIIDKQLCTIDKRMTKSIGPLAQMWGTLVLARRISIWTLIVWATWQSWWPLFWVRPGTWLCIPGRCKCCHVSCIRSIMRWLNWSERNFFGEEFNLALHQQVKGHK